MDRAQLEAVVDAYLEAAIAKDRSLAPFADKVAFSENNVRLELGEGTWRTLSGRGTYSHYLADPAAGRVGFIGTVRENGVPALLDLLITLEDGRIVEVESVFIRDALAGVRYEQEIGQPEKVWFEAVPEAKRLSREQMIASVDKYFQGMENNDGRGDYSFFDPECDRIEHALKTTNVKTPMAYGHSTDTDFASMTAEEQWKTGFLGFVTKIRDRRFVILDEERQVAFAFVTLDHNGTVRVLHMTTGKDFVVPPYFDVPRTLQVMEAFKLKGEKLYRVEMTLYEPNYGARPPQTQVAPPQPSAPEPASREALEALLERTLQALESHHAKALPLAPGVRYTENGESIEIGDGLWGTICDYAGSGAARPETPAYRLVMADPGAGQAAFLGGMLEETTRGMLYLRIRALGGRISEIEAIAIRHEWMGERGGTVTLFQPRMITGFDPDGFVSPDWLGAAAPGDREGLVQAADAWFDAVQSGRSAGLKLAPGAARRDNGHAASNAPDAPPLDPEVPAFRPYALGLAEQIEAGVFRRISRVRERRHLVDADQGLVLTVAVQDNPGDLKSIEVPGVGEVGLPGLSASGPGAEINSRPEELQSQLFGARQMPNVRVPTSEIVVQATKVVDGRIAGIETLSRGAILGVSGGWPA
jgi:hypothetical protein